MDRASCAAAHGTKKAQPDTAMPSICSPDYFPKKKYMSSICGADKKAQLSPKKRIADLSACSVAEYLHIHQA
jgi:hypothetical protein